MAFDHHTAAITVQDYVDRARFALADGYDAIKIDFLNWDEKGNILNETNRLGLLAPRTFPFGQ